ncbi:protein phosphatase 2C domain-containing protein, partial [Pseudomonas aeruginosa]|uniref:protein phosphatase 2C domain-containing protein n=1 Tax=Pseudomonas aeruginosa TaxID=287 RepID=UPI002712C550
MRLLASGASVRPAHQQDDSPNQDALAVSGIRGGWCVAVADGLGSRPLSHFGSRKAVQLSRHVLRCQADITHAAVTDEVRKAWLACFGER